MSFSKCGLPFLLLARRKDGYGARRLNIDSQKCERDMLRSIEGKLRMLVLKINYLLGIEGKS